MMECTRCGSKIRDDVRFCEGCGAAVERRCSACAAALAAGARFCGACGQQAVAGSPSPTDRPIHALEPPKPDTYTPDHLAKRILGVRGVVVGERKQVTVLFADIKGSLELIEGSDPEHAQELLDAAIAVMMGAVHSYEGTVNKVLGDGIMALFGAPLAQEDHAVRAAYAALTLQREMQSVTEEMRRTRGVEVRARVGLHSGEVVVRAIGNDLSMDYDAIGPTVHLASRMEQLAAPGTSRITAHTLRFAEGFVDVKPLGPIPVKGLDAPIEVYELIGAGAARTRMQVAAARGLSRFVGRDAEIDTLSRALARAGEGAGQIVSVVGEAGIGKSRLFYEFIRSHRVSEWLVLENASVSYGKADAWHPVIDLLKGYFAIDDGDDLRRIAEKVAGKLVMLDESLRSELAPVLALLGVSVEDAVWSGLEPAEQRSRILDAIKRLLFRESQVQPLVLVFEDLHWIDGETQALLDSLVESLPTASILVLTNYRPEYKHGWGARSYYTQIRVDPLGREFAEALAGALLGAEPGLDDLKAMLIGRTDGNPLFLEECVRALVEGGELVGERGAYRLKKEIGSIKVPATVQAIIAARIDRLEPASKDLLQCAAIVGHYVPLAILEEVTGTARDELRDVLTELQAAEFLYEAQIFPNLMYTFKHALTHEVAYNSVLQDRRRAWHRQVGDAIANVYPDRRRHNYMAIISHYERGEAWDKSARMHLNLERIG
jgi:class 3 adenylate cyclase